MILGIGCDIVKTSRIALLIKKYGQAFKRRVYTDFEISKEPSGCAGLQASYYAKRFAAKEAFAKALGTGITHSIGFLDIELSNTELGAPKIYCSKVQDIHILVSLSDEKEFAIAYVVLQKA